MGPPDVIENSPACNTLITAVRRHFAYLFGQYGFEVVHCVDARPIGQYLVLVLASSACRMKIEVDQGIPILFFGHADAPNLIGEFWQGTQYWWDEVTLNAFSRETKPQLAVRWPQGTPPTLEGNLGARSTMLRPYLDEHLAAFTAPRPDGWWQDYDAFMARQLGGRT